MTDRGPTFTLQQEEFRSFTRNLRLMTCKNEMAYNGLDATDSCEKVYEDDNDDEESE